MAEKFVITTQNLKEPYEWGEFVWVTITEGLHAGVDWMAKWKNLLGGRVKGFEKKIDVAIAAGKEKLQQAAQAMGCDAIIGLRITIEGISVGGDAVVTVSLYGAAVRRLKSASAGMSKPEPESESALPETIHRRFPGGRGYLSGKSIEEQLGEGGGRSRY